jgi:hypothetical protein
METVRLRPLGVGQKDGGRRIVLQRGKKLAPNGILGIIVKFQSEYNPLIDNALEGPRGRIVQAIFCLRRRHQPRRPPPAKIKPGSPATAMGPSLFCNKKLVTRFVPKLP